MVNLNHRPTASVWRPFNDSLHGPASPMRGTVLSTTYGCCSAAQLCLTLCEPVDCQHTRHTLHHLHYLHYVWVCSDICALNWWCHPTIMSSVIPFSSCPQSFPASGSFEISRLFASGGQSIGVSASASVLPKNTQNWSPLGWTGWISLQSKGLSRVFSNTTVQKHQFFGAQPSSQSNSHIHTHHRKNHSLD